jgi:AcrR family transcriptional regulator
VPIGQWHRRAQIIEGRRCVHAGGFDGASMDDVAQAAGISRPLIFRIFDTKEHLCRALLTSVSDEFIAEFEDVDLAEIRRRGDIVPIMQGIARRHPDAFRLLWRQAAHEPAFAAFSREFRKGARRVRPDPLSTTTTPRCGSAACSR